LLAILVAAGLPAAARRDPLSGGQERAGMTWVLWDRQPPPAGLVDVGGDASTDPERGDTSASAALPLLCLNVTGEPVPWGVAPVANHGWARGWLTLTLPVRGTSLTSRTQADGLCARFLGEGWRMAEYHDGWYGDPPRRGGGQYWGRGSIPTGTRFWVANNDAAANPWD
jgi:hypothetical protein